MSNEWSNLQALLTAGVALVLVLGALLVMTPRLKRWWADRRIHSLIARLGPAHAQNVVLPDGLGGFVYVEHMVLTAQGVLVAGVRPYRGTIFAAENIDYWTQVLGGRSFKFANPLAQLEADTQAVRGLFPNLTLRPVVVFSKHSLFPKGKPDAVLSYAELRLQAKDSTPMDIPPALQKQWQQLLAQTQPASKNERRLMKEHVDPKPFVIGVGLLMMALLWLSWRLTWPAGMWN